VAITNTLKQLRANDGSAGNLDQFRNQALPEVKTLMTELKKQAGSRDRPKQEMLWACMMLEKVLAESPGAETPSKEEKTLDTHIANARALINRQPLPVQPEGDP